MEMIKKTINKAMLNTYVFNLIIGLILVVLTLLFINQGDFVKLLFGLSVAYFGLFLSLYSGKASILKKFYKSLEDEDTSDYRIVENTILLSNCLVSFSFNVPVKISYHDITLVRHDPNVFEKARPGYKGNHKLFIKANEKEILIPIEDEETAQKIMNFFETKNPKIQFQHKTEKFKETQLMDLQNYSVKSRF